VDRFDAGLEPKELVREMRQRADAAGSEIHLPGVCLCIVDELAHRFCRELEARDQELRRIGDEADRHERGRVVRDLELQRRNHRDHARIREK